MRTLTRRKVMAGLAAANAVAMMPGKAFGGSPGKARFILVVLRGALDGLAAVPPYGDALYRAARGALALGQPGPLQGVRDLDGFFGLHPALVPLYPLYEARQMLIVPAVGVMPGERSHAAALRALEDAEAGACQGWLDRATDLLADAEDVDVAVFRPGDTSVRSRQTLPDLVADICCGNATLERLLAANGGDLDLGAAQRNRATTFRDAAIRTGEWLNSADDRRVAMIESFGWDTHADQGAHDGRLAVALAGLADGLTALAMACGDAWHGTVVMVATEFGRSVGMNAMGGTDHGVGSIALLLGGAVAGGRVIGRWPGLAREHLHRGFGIMPTTDLHAITKAVLIEHLGLPRIAVDDQVFRGRISPGPLPGLLRI